MLLQAEHKDVAGSCLSPAYDVQLARIEGGSWDVRRLLLAFGAGSDWQ